VKKVLIIFSIPLLFSCNENSKVVLEKKKEIKKQEIKIEDYKNENTKLQSTIEIYETDTINPIFEEILREDYGLIKENEIIFKPKN
tara:strand:+ start:83 stop:340 length:258 start_codon:yes stop_codon:yes gene_type:complete